MQQIKDSSIYIKLYVHFKERMYSYMLNAYSMVDVSLYQTVWLNKLKTHIKHKINDTVSIFYKICNRNLNWFSFNPVALKFGRGYMAL